jgi:hypothetical protein
MMEEGDEISPLQEVDFCTLGMFIIGTRFSFAFLLLVDIPCRPQSWASFMANLAIPECKRISYLFT